MILCFSAGTEKSELDWEIRDLEVRAQMKPRVARGSIG